MQEIRCKILTPNASLADVYATMVTMPGAEGDLGVLYGHEPMVVALRAGGLSINADGGKSIFYISEGMARITSNDCIIMVDYAVRDTGLINKEVPHNDIDSSTLCALSKKSAARKERFIAFCGIVNS